VADAPFAIKGVDVSLPRKIEDYINQNRPFGPVDADDIHDSDCAKEGVTG